MEVGGYGRGLILRYYPTMSIEAEENHERPQSE